MLKAIWVVVGPKRAILQPLLLFNPAILPFDPDLVMYKTCISDSKQMLKDSLCIAEAGVLKSFCVLCFPRRPKIITSVMLLILKTNDPRRLMETMSPF